MRRPGYLGDDLTSKLLNLPSLKKEDFFFPDADPLAKAVLSKCNKDICTSWDLLQYGTVSLIQNKVASDDYINQMMKQLNLSRDQIITYWTAPSSEPYKPPLQGKELEAWYAKNRQEMAAQGAANAAAQQAYFDRLAYEASRGRVPETKEQAQAAAAAAAADVTINPPPPVVTRPAPKPIPKMTLPPDWSFVPSTSGLDFLFKNKFIILGVIAILLIPILMKLRNR